VGAVAMQAAAVAVAVAAECSNLERVGDAWRVDDVTDPPH
jgi:hypothetical protein